MRLWVFKCKVFDSTLRLLQSIINGAHAYRIYNQSVINIYVIPKLLNSLPLKLYPWNIESLIIFVLCQSTK